jgi:hypothetical protein
LSSDPAENARLPSGQGGIANVPILGAAPLSVYHPAVALAPGPCPLTIAFDEPSGAVRLR